VRRVILEASFAARVVRSNHKTAGPDHFCSGATHAVAQNLSSPRPNQCGPIAARRL